MATKKEFDRRCRELECEVTDNGTTIEVHAPEGMVFAGPLQHSIFVDYNHPRGAWRKSEAYDALLEDMEAGIEPCDDPDCEICNPIEDDE